MNTQESCVITCPNNKTEECAKFIIDDLTGVFTLTDLMVIGRRYTFGCWVRSDEAGTLIVNGGSASSTSDWKRFTHTFVADSVDLSFAFAIPGTYYIYNSQLEVGNKATDWVPAPEDTDEAISETNERVDNATTEANDQMRDIRETVSELVVDTNYISASVKDVNSRFDEVTGQLSDVNTKIASMELRANEIELAIQSIDGADASKVTTTTGTFDEYGLTVDKSDSVTKTQITPDGMTVYAKDNNNAVMLEATSAGVEAKDLHATTFLKVGGRSRFENYGDDRTGCFWIGGD